MDFLTIDPSYTLDCSAYNVSPIFIAAGALLIVFSGIFVGYNLAKSPLSVLIDGYKKQRKITDSKRSKIILGLQVIKMWRALLVIAVLLFFMIVFVINASFIIISLSKSGCL